MQTMVRRKWADLRGLFSRLNCNMHVKSPGPNPDHDLTHQASALTPTSSRGMRHRIKPRLRPIEIEHQIRSPQQADSNTNLSLVRPISPPSYQAMQCHPSAKTFIINKISS